MEITDATASPSEQKLAAPSTSVPIIAGQFDVSGTPYSRPTRRISATSTKLTMMQCASSPPKWARAGSGVARLYLSEATVKGYVSRMLDKLGLANRTQAGLLAHDAGLITRN